MNNDLTNLFSILPEGILIYDEKMNKISLANKELRRLL